MIDVPRILRMAADAAEEFDVKVRTRTRENREDGVDTQAIVDALATLGASAAAVVLDSADRARGRVNRECECGECSCEPVSNKSENSSVDIATEVERVASRLGLVNEDELAALRKRIVELERELASAQSTNQSTKTAKPTSKSATNNRKPAKKA